MFLRTTIFQKRPKNPLTCSRRRKVQKISPRHQSKPLKPCWVRGIDTKGVSLDFTLMGLQNYNQIVYLS